MCKIRVYHFIFGVAFWLSIPLPHEQMRILPLFQYTPRVVQYMIHDVLHNSRGIQEWVRPCCVLDYGDTRECYNGFNEWCHEGELFNVKTSHLGCVAGSSNEVQKTFHHPRGVGFTRMNPSRDHNSLFTRVIYICNGTSRQFHESIIKTSYHALHPLIVLSTIAMYSDIHILWVEYVR